MLIYTWAILKVLQKHMRHRTIVGPSTIVFNILIIF